MIHKLTAVVALGMYTKCANAQGPHLIYRAKAPPPTLKLSRIRVLNLCV